MSLSFFATCPKGLENLLLRELVTLGACEVKETVAGVSFKGDFTLGMRVCLWTRLASRVLLEISEFYAGTDTDLYLGALAVDYEKYFEVSNTIAVSFKGTSEAIRNTQYGALKIKDAVCDYFLKRNGIRPNVDKDNPDILITCHLDRKDNAHLLFDLSGNALHMRDFNRHTGMAPLKENLACAMLLRSGYNGSNLVDPMCGSGTLLLEAAAMATDTAPGICRDHYGFLQLKLCDRSAYTSLVEEMHKRSREGMLKFKQSGYKLFGFDADERIIDIALENAKKSGFADIIQFQVQSVETLVNPFDDLNDETQNKNAPSLFVITNPPYGQRMGNFNELISLYTKLGAVFKEQFRGAVCAVISSSEDLLSCLRLHADKIYKLYNGELLCQLRIFSIRQGEEGSESLSKDNLATDFANRLRKNLLKMNKWAKTLGLEAYRVYDADVPEYAAAIDYYKGYYVISTYKAQNKVSEKIEKRHELDMLGATIEVTGVSGSKVILKSREVKKGNSQYERLREDNSALIEIREGPFAFKVNLYDYLDTGLFLDGRLIRQYLYEHASNCSVLNLFAYTCSASVAAALGGASLITSVDMSKTYLEWGYENFLLNQIEAHSHEFIQADVLAFVSKDPEHKYDLIYVDPPTFSNSKRMQNTFDVRRDHLQLLGNLTRFLRDGGEVVFCTNLRSFRIDERLDEFGYSVTDLSSKTLPFDFKRNEHIHHCYSLIYHEKERRCEPVAFVSSNVNPKWSKVLHCIRKTNEQEIIPKNKSVNGRSLRASTTVRFNASGMTEIHTDGNRDTSAFRHNNKRNFKSSKLRHAALRPKSSAKPRVFGPEGVKEGVQ